MVYNVCCEMLCAWWLAHGSVGNILEKYLVCTVYKAGIENEGKINFTKFI